MVLTGTSNPGEPSGQFPTLLANTFRLVNICPSLTILLPFKILFVCFCFLVWLRAHKSSHEPLCDIPPYWMSHCWGGGFQPLPYLCLSYPSLCGPSIVCWIVAVQLALSFSSGRIGLYMGIDWVHSWEEGNSGSSYTTMLDCLLDILFLTYSPSDGDV